REALDQRVVDRVVLDVAVLVGVVDRAAEVRRVAVLHRHHHRVDHVPALAGRQAVDRPAGVGDHLLGGLAVARRIEPVLLVAGLGRLGQVVERRQAELAVDGVADLVARDLVEAVDAVQRIAGPIVIGRAAVLDDLIAIAEIDLPGTVLRVAERALTLAISADTGSVAASGPWASRPSVSVRLPTAWVAGIAPCSWTVGPRPGSRCRSCRSCIAAIYGTAGGDCSCGRSRNLVSALQP